MKNSNQGMVLSLARSFSFTPSVTPVAEDRFVDKVYTLTPAQLYVYAPVSEVPRLRQVLAKTGRHYQFNVPNLRATAQTAVCFFKRNQLAAWQQQALRQAQAAGAQVESLQIYLEQTLGCVETDLLDAEYLLHIESEGDQTTSMYERLRRVLDIGFAATLLLVLAPLLLLVAVAIRLESPGPVLFRQWRTGLFNREFEIIKFRSMRQDAERDGARWASRNDCRITQVGRFIRKTRLDELPQLLNVLKGDMSLIGPRPEREVFIRDLEQQVPFYRFRHLVKPGITGYAQVMYCYGASVEDAQYKHRFDLYYIKHRGLGLDLTILWRTLRIVLTGQGV